MILTATALICSRTLFFSFHDPEGPNLLIVTVLALVIYALSAAAYLLAPAGIKGMTRLSAAIGMQLLSVIILYFCMK